MAIGSGLGSQFGFVEESTYGTAVTVTRFLEIQKESIKNDVALHFSRGTKDLITRSSRYRTYSKGCGGGMNCFPVPRAPSHPVTRGRSLSR